MRDGEPDDEFDAEPDDEIDDEIDDEAIRQMLGLVITRIDQLSDPLEIWDGIGEAVPMAIVVGDHDTARALVSRAATLTDEGFEAIFASRLIQLEAMVGAATDDVDLLASAMDRLRATMATLDETSLATHLVLVRQFMTYGRPVEANGVAWQLVDVARAIAPTRPVLAAVALLRVADAIEDFGDALGAAAVTDAALETLDEHTDALDRGEDGFYEETSEEAEALRANIWNQAGWIAWRAEQLERADVAFAEAERRFRELGEEEAADGLLRMRAKTANGLGEMDEARALFEAAIDAARRHDWPIDQAKALIGLARIVRGNGDVDGADALVTEAQAIAEAEDDRAIAASCDQFLMRSAMLRGDLGEARRRADQRLTLLRTGGVEGDLNAALRDAGQMHSLTGDLEGAVELYEEGLAMAVFHDWLSMVQELQHALAVVRSQQCRWTEALDLLDGALHIATDAGNAMGITNAVWFQGRVAVAAALDDATDHLDRAEELMHQVQITRYLQYLAQERVRLALADDDLDGAARHLEAARTIGSSIEDAMGLADTAALAAELDLRTGDVARARERATAALLEHEASGDLTMTARDHLVLGRAALAAGDDQADRHLREALGLGQRLGMLDLEVLAHVALAQLASTNDDQAGADAHGAAARAGWDELTSRRPPDAPTDRWTARRHRVLEPLRSQP